MNQSEVKAILIKILTEDTPEPMFRNSLNKLVTWWVKYTFSEPKYPLIKSIWIKQHGFIFIHYEIEFIFKTKPFHEEKLIYQMSFDRKLSKLYYSALNQSHLIRLEADAVKNQSNEAQLKIAFGLGQTPARG